MRATSGKSLFTETLYVAQIIRYVIVYGIASERALGSFMPKSVVSCSNLWTFHEGTLGYLASHGGAH